MMKTKLKQLTINKDFKKGDTICNGLQYFTWMNNKRFGVTTLTRDLKYDERYRINFNSGYFNYHANVFKKPEDTKKTFELEFYYMVVPTKLLSNTYFKKLQKNFKILSSENIKISGVEIKLRLCGPVFKKNDSKNSNATLIKISKDDIGYLFYYYNRSCNSLHIEQFENIFNSFIFNVYEDTDKIIPYLIPINND